MSRPALRVKVCCIASPAEARLAVELGADALGLVSAMPSGPGPIPEERIAAIAAEVPAPTATFLLTCLRDVEAIAAQHARCGTTTLQLVDALERGTHADLRALVPGVELVQVIHVRGPASVEEAVAVAPHVDALLLDSGDPSLATKELGGTGRVHDWDLSAEIVRRADAPVLLAGGLRPENVAAAVARVAPAGLDLCTGVRTDGALDAARLRAFLAAARA